MKKIVGTAILSIFFVVGGSVSAVSGDYKLPDTGIQTCYDNTKEIPCPNPGQAFYGQDAQHHSAQPRYTDNGDGTVTDLNTGLMWQQADGNSLNFQGAIAYCEDLTLPSGGYLDWRLPTFDELVSLPNYGRYNPSIDTEYFPDCRTSGCYWTSSAYAVEPEKIWVVSFLNGYPHLWEKTVSDWTRCVRAGY